MKWKDIVIIIAVTAAAVTFWNNRKMKSNIASSQSIVDEQESHIQRERRRNGQLVQEKQAAVVSSRSKDEIIDRYAQAYSDLKNNHEIKIKNVHSYYRAKMSTMGSGEAEIRDTTIYLKSIKTVFPSFEINDGYLSLGGYFDDEKLKYSYIVTDSLSIAYHWDKKGFWIFKKRDGLKVSFASSNPNTTLLNASTFAIEDKKKTQITIGPHIGYDFINGLSFGLSVQKPLVRIRF